MIPTSVLLSSVGVRDTVKASSGLLSKAKCIHHLFEEQAVKQAEAVAVQMEERSLTYRQLNDRSNQLAHFLRGRGVGPEVLVGLCLERTPDLVVGILGILKAGGAYVPLDVAYPKDRVAFMLADAKVPVIVTEGPLAGKVAGEDIQVVCLDREWPEIAREPSSNPDSGVTPDNLAYVIYTSGSTGRPKGSLITHGNVVRLFQATEGWFHFSQQDVWTLFHSCAFDFSVWELWGALCYGGRLVVVPFGVSRSPETFYRLLYDARVTVLNQTPSAFRQLIRAEEAFGQNPDLALRLLIFGGEALDMKTLKPWFDRHGDHHPQLVNMYGITETTVHVTYRPLRAQDLSSGSVIGKPLPDLQVHLLDDQQNPVADGLPGEIFVGGAGLGRGYLNRPELTAQKFLPHPFDSQPGARLYRSGDLGRLLPNGDLEYLGRIDHQVKIRGFRIELGEIESVLNQHPAIRESVVLARDDAAGEKRLVAYLIRRTTIEVDPATLRPMLRERLPEYMVPSAFVFIDRLPLTTNGKLDVHALPNPTRDAGSAPALAADGAPRSDLKGKIAAIWEEVLALPRVGYDESFFDIGGNSIHLAEVHAKLQTLLGTPFTITKLFQYPTVGSLSAHIAGDGASSGVQQPALDRTRRQREAQALRKNQPR